MVEVNLHDGDKCRGTRYYCETPNLDCRNCEAYQAMPESDKKRSCNDSQLQRLRDERGTRLYHDEQELVIV